MMCCGHVARIDWRSSSVVSFVSKIDKKILDKRPLASDRVTLLNKNNDCRKHTIETPMRGWHHKGGQSSTANGAQTSFFGECISSIEKRDEAA